MMTDKEGKFLCWTEKDTPREASLLDGIFDKPQEVACRFGRIRDLKEGTNVFVRRLDANEVAVWEYTLKRVTSLQAVAK